MLIGAVVGAALSAGGSMYAANKQEKAAKAAANAQAQAADSTPAQVTQSAAAQTTNTQAAARTSTQAANARRMTVSSTVNPVAANGLRRTLG